MADVFVSYKREDKARVAAIAAGLEAEGFSVWWDPGIPLGESYAASIRRELDAATTVLAVWSTVSVHSTWVQEEATLAVSAEGRRAAQAAGAHVFVWDLPSRRIIGRVETGESGTYLAFTPDGRRLLAATAEGEAGMYDPPAP
ncbi:MAG: toll/interleukin-1 receptor domain-containing protein [Hydrogenophilaceae bacterium]|jgi:hypothetical protein|nr:toll/interleukin-1 receptor domain-containing protein [Hydrogenophilaceae bacterium]